VWGVRHGEWGRAEFLPPCDTLAEHRQPLKESVAEAVRGQPALFGRR
jgi:hypothetical protein